MEQLGIIVNIRKLIKYWVLLVIGLSLIFYGVIGYYENRQLIMQNISDEEIIERAKGLGMIEIKDQVLDNTSKESN